MLVLILRREISLFMNQKIKTSLNNLIKQYYTNYYRDQLGLKDYQWRVKNRLNEDNDDFYYTASKHIKKIETLLNLRFDNRQKVLVVGAGTGIEMIQFAKKGCLIYGIEPDKKALEILKLRSQLQQLDQNKIKQAVAEKIPYPDNFFDFVYCWQVLEHVQNVEQSIREMVRVTKPDGYIFIGCPDYRQIAEPHYKLYLPLFLPRWINKILLKLRGRKTEFFDTLQSVNAKKIRNILRHCPVTMMQVINTYTDKELKIHDWRRLMFWIQETFEIEQDQNWLIKKL